MELFRKPYTQKDFAWTRWGVRDIKRTATEVMARKKARYQEIKKIPKRGRTFENTIAALDKAAAEVEAQISFIDFLMNVSPDEKIRNASKAEIKRIVKTFTDLEYDEGIYKAIREYSARAGTEKLAEDQVKLLADTLRDYRRMGFELSRQKRKELKKLTQKIFSLGQNFTKNINEYRDFITVSREELKGLPENYVSRLKKNKRGGYIVSLDYPELHPFLENAQSAEKRKELALKSLKRGGAGNLKLIGEIIKLRGKNAEILGYKNHADFKTEVKMAKNSKTALKFVSDMLSKLKKGTKRELAELFKLKVKATGNKKAKIEFYDTAFYINKLKNEKYKVYSEKVREYFPLERVKKGIFDIYSKVFSLKFQKLNNYPVWYKDVELYKVSDKNESLIGYFGLDLYPRNGKYGHAATFQIVNGWKNKNDYTTPFSCMVANFPGPSKNNPSLLDHNEVITFFHEFGHLMHGLLTKANFVYQSSFSVARDFVEAPSQMLEYWTWNKKMLNFLSGHYRNQSQKLPARLLARLIKARDAEISYLSTKQLIYGLYDLKIHSGGNVDDVNSLYSVLNKKFTGIEIPRNTFFIAGWGHMVGYDAGYYGYMWSRVYAADMFTRFKKEGLLNPKTGMDYRREILEKGSSREEMKSVVKFLGRKPNDRAFLEELRLK